MATKIELFLGGSWTDVTTYVRQDPGLDITFGVQNESSVADANTCTAVFNNGDGRFTPRNTAGAYYGNLKRNTPMRVTVGSTVRFVGEVPEFKPRWDESSKVAVVTVVAAGILRRLQHASSLESTLTLAVRQLAATDGDITGYWPMEDTAGSTTFASALPGGTPGVITGAPVLAAVDLSVGVHEVPTFSGTARAAFYPAAATSTAFTAGVYIQLPTSGLTGGEELFRVNTAGTASSWRIIYSPTGAGGVFLQVIASDGITELLATGNLSGTNGLDGTVFYVKIECSNSGSNVAYAFSDINPGGGTLSGSIVGQSCGAPNLAAINSGVIKIPAGVAVAAGHVVLGTSSTALFHSSFDSGLAGYAGESIETRFARLAAAYGVTINVTSGTAHPVEMGAQPDGSLLDVLRAAEKADAGGILRDSIDAVSLTYITRNARFNDQGALLTLDYSAKQIIPPLEPTDDDQQLRNDVKVNRAFGSSARATLASGALSTAAYPSGVGPYPFEDTYATYLDSQLPYLAQWLLALGTVDETRWPAVTVDLIANPSLVTAAEALRPGYRLKLTNLPAFAGVSSVELQVVGWREHLAMNVRTITFICVPGGAVGGTWNAFELDDTVYGTVDDNRLGF